ncbi:uncharacterized protein LOC128298606 [Anopheles moucheti]|uniref:uncharacterized protein LOC128298606 n=1 Tax=Anopheles moucheti TaxID=186751 RepID=UPI0022F120FC|nr:uncharacterized protein LOC128298606 [Anopheles moucheti]
MKHQQVVPDYAAMVKTSGTCLCLVFSGWVLFKLVQAVFWLPGYLEKNQDQLYRRVEQRSRIVPNDKVNKVDDETHLGALVAGSSDPELQEEGVEKATTMEEKGENDAVECEGDNKKDK